MSVPPYCRMILVALAPQLMAFSTGGCIGYGTVLLHQLRSQDSSIQVDLNLLTWITSIHGLAGLGGLLMPSLMQKFGRKLSIIMCCVLLLSGWFLAYAATSASMLFMAEALLGFTCNCCTIINFITISEMLAPKIRSISMMLLGIIQAAGISFISIAGNLIHFQFLALIMCFPVAIALVTALCCPESPLWLAYKGKIDECEKAFLWLRGSNDESIKTLQAILATQTESTKTKVTMSVIKNKFSIITKRDFYLPSLYMLIVLMNIYLSGGVCLHIYGQYVMEAVSDNKKATTLGFMIFSATVFIGAIIGIIIMRSFSCKFIFAIASLRILFLFGGALVSYLQKTEIISDNPWYFLLCLESYMVVYTSGLNSMTFALAIELMPVKHRGVGGILYNIITCSLHFASLKLFPSMILALDVWGIFLLFGINGIIFHVLLWKYVPETKNKSLLEIEDCYNRGKSHDKKLKGDIHEPML